MRIGSFVVQCIDVADHVRTLCPARDGDLYGPSDWRWDWGPSPHAVQFSTAKQALFVARWFQEEYNTRPLDYYAVEVTADWIAAASLIWSTHDDQ